MKLLVMKRSDRRKRVIARLEAQLVANTKTIKKALVILAKSNTSPLNESDTKRINKEITTLKSRIK